MSIKIEETGRGFGQGYFVDRNGMACTIQESSIATEPCIWLGISPDQMQLTLENAADLIPLLQRFVETGYIRERFPSLRVEP